MRSFSVTVLIIGVLIALANGCAGATDSTGSSTFLVTGTVTNVAALEIFIDYDATTLANPRATAGSVTAGGLFVANPKNSGRVIIAFITTTPLTGSGALATITFDTIGTGAGKIIAVSSVARDSTGNRLAVGNFAVTQLESSSSGPGKPLDSPSPVESPGTSSTPRSPMNPTEGVQPYRGWPGSGAGVEVSGEMNDRSATQPPPEPEPKPPEPDRDIPTKADEGDSTPASTPAEATWKPPVVESALYRFSRIQGEMTPKMLQTLLLSGSHKSIRQEPAVVLSDGKSIVKITIDFPNSRLAPQFMLNEAKVLYMGREDDHTWVLEILPNRNVPAASVLVLSSGGTMEIPLTVAPPAPEVLTQGKALNETAFFRFLKERGTTSAPLGDLNHDGRRDYLDDYIYTCNYEFMKNTAPEQARKQATENSVQ